jgi:hypothetical protein
VAVADREIAVEGTQPKTTPPSVKQFRFGTGAGNVNSHDTLLELAQRAASLGYSTFGMADHFMMSFAPLGEFTLSKDAFLASPVVAIGTLDEVCAKLEEPRARFGISYWTAAVGSRPAVFR